MKTSEFCICWFLFLALPTHIYAKKPVCTNVGFRFCEDPNNLKYYEVGCNQYTCRWKLKDLKPHRRPRFCDRENIVILTRNQDIKDSEEPCLLWEFVYGRFATPAPVISPPSRSPSGRPTQLPSEPPTDQPSASQVPTQSQSPTPIPTAVPSLSASPSVHSTSLPSLKPSVYPSAWPSQTPSVYPSVWPSQTPSVSLSARPSLSMPPSQQPSQTFSLAPSYELSQTPSMAPSKESSLTPSMAPSQVPSLAETDPLDLAVPGNDEHGLLPTEAWMDMKTVLVTFFISDPLNVRHRMLDTFDVGSREKLLLLTKRHMLKAIPELSDLQLLIATYQEAELVDKSVAFTEAITGKIYLATDVSMTRQKINKAIEHAFQGEALHSFVVTLVNDGDPFLAKIYKADYGISPGLPIFANTQSQETTEEDNAGVMGTKYAIIVLSGVAAIFLFGIVAFVCLARRSYPGEPMSPNTKGTIKEMYSPGSRDEPPSIVGGVHGVAVSELAAESMVGGESDAISLYSYCSIHAASVNLSASFSYDPSSSYETSFCRSPEREGNNDGESQRPVQSRTEAGYNGDKSCEGSRVRSTPKRKCNPHPNNLPRTDPVNLYRFDDNRSQRSDKSDEQAKRFHSPKVGLPGTTNESKTRSSPRIEAESLAVDSVSLDSCGSETDSEHLAEANPSEQQSGSPRGSSSPYPRQHSEKKGSRTQKNMLALQLDFDNMDEDSESLSLFSGPSGIAPPSGNNPLTRLVDPEDDLDDNQDAANFCDEDESDDDDVNVTCGSATLSWLAAVGKDASPDKMAIV